MNLFLLFRDELTGFYKSSVMLILWIGLPLISIAAFLFLPSNADGVAMSLVTSGIVSSIGGWLAAIMLAIHIINEKNNHVYELFLVRPVKRSQLILAKFLAVFACVALASVLAILLGFIIDYFYVQHFSLQLLRNSANSLAVALSIIAIECAAGALVGVLASTALAGVLFVVITHNIASLTVIMPIMNKMNHSVVLGIIAGIFLSALFLSSAIIVFKKKQF